MVNIEQIKKDGFLKVSDEIISATRNQLAKLFNVETEKHSFHIQHKGKKDRRVWSVRFESKEAIKGMKRYNHLFDKGTKIRETLEDKNRFPMEEGELRAAFRLEGNYNSWKFLGVFKFTGKDNPNDSEKSDMPNNCYTNCYEQISDGLILEDWQNEKS